MRKEILSLLVDGNLSIRESLQRLCDSSRQILFVVENGVLKAALSDGDVRRFLLKGGSLESPVSEAANYKPVFLMSTEREHASSLVAERHLPAVPIVDDDMRIQDVVFRFESINVDSAKIRVLGNEDLPMMLEFFDQMAGDTRAMFNRNDINRIRAINHFSRGFDEPDGEIHFAATFKEQDGTEKMVGYVFLWDIGTKIPWLGIAVREDWKGHHLGRRLLQYVDEWAMPKNYGGVMLTSVPANIRAHSLYTRMGFEYYGVYLDSEFLYIKRYDA